MKKIIVLIIGLIFLFLNVNAYAAIIILKSGKKIEGEILEENSFSVKIMVNDIPNMFYRYQIEKIISDEELQAQRAEQEAGKSSTREIELISRFFEVSGTHADLERIIDNYVKQFPIEIQELLRKRLKTEEIIEKLVPLYSKNYTERELEELIEFFQSPTGQKQLQLAPQFFDGMMKIVSDYFKKQLEGLKK